MPSGHRRWRRFGSYRSLNMVHVIIRTIMMKHTKNEPSQPTLKSSIPNRPFRPSSNACALKVGRLWKRVSQRRWWWLHLLLDRINGLLHSFPHNVLLWISQGRKDGKLSVVQLVQHTVTYRSNRSRTHRISPLRIVWRHPDSTSVHLPWQFNSL